MSNVNLEMVELFKKELKLCNVKANEQIAILTKGNELEEYAAAFMEAANQLNAKVFEVNTPMVSGAVGSFGTNPLTGNEIVIEMLKKCDMVIDLVLLLFSQEQIELQEAGVRILLVTEPFDVLKRMFPKKEDKDRMLAAHKYLEESKILRFVNAAGTDITYKIENSPTLIEYGFADEPGRWDHFPAGLAATIGTEKGVNGTVVLDEGDILFPFNRYVQEKLTFHVKDGYITSIEGGFEATLVKEYMEGFNDPKAYAISHIGWGLNERAKWSSLAFDDNVFGMDGRCFYGNVLFSTGPNNELGGDNDTQCHLDIPMKNCTLYLDDELIVDEGEIVKEDMKIL